MADTELLERPRTWSGQRAYRFDRWHEPGSVVELREVVAAGTRVRVVGGGHGYNDLVDIPDGELVSLRRLPTEVEVDGVRRVARVTAWSTYAEVGERLHAAGWALPNTASVSGVTLAGAIATGSHGSGDGNQGLCGAVVAIEMLDAGGATRLVRRGDPDFPGVLVSLGALGVWTRVHLAVRPTYGVCLSVRLDLPWSEVLADLDAVTSAAYSVSMFTDLAGPAVAQLWLKSRVGDPAPRLDVGRAAPPRMARLLTGGDPHSLVRLLGVPGPWHQRLPHFSLGATAARRAEVQSEYFVPRERAVEALARLRLLSPCLSPTLLVAEIRTVAADDAWLSPAGGGPVLGIHFTWGPDQAAVAAAVALVEAALLPLGARPHWGKVFAVRGARLTAAYPRLADFAALRDRLDPDRVFDNPYLRRVLGR